MRCLEYSALSSILMSKCAVICATWRLTYVDVEYILVIKNKQSDIIMNFLVSELTFRF